MSINNVKFVGVERGNANITVDHVGEGGVKQDMYIFFTKFFKLCFHRIHITRDTHSPERQLFV